MRTLWPLKIETLYNYFHPTVLCDLIHHFTFRDYLNEKEKSNDFIFSLPIDSVRKSLFNYTLKAIE